MILDQYGHPIDPGQLREPQSEQPDLASRVGWMHREFDNHPGRGLTPARLNAILQAAERGDMIQQLELADDMEERDGHIFAQLSTRKTAVTTLEWDVEPPENAGADEQSQADQVRDWLRNIPEFDGLLRDMMDAVLKGFSPIETWWELEEGTLQPRFAARPQRWLCLAEDRNTLQLRDGTTQYGVPLKPGGWLVHVHKARNGYLSRASLARVLAWPYLFKHYAVRDLAEFLEIYGIPVRIGKYPAGATDAEKRKLLQAVVSIGHNAGGVIPQSMALELLEAAQGVDGPFRTMWDGMDAVESKIILGQTLTSGEGTHGTQALGAVHNEVRLDILKADAKAVAATLTAQLVRTLVLLNIPGANPKRLPKLCIDVPEPEDLQLYADALPKLAAAGMRIGVKDMHRRLRIEEADEGEDVLQGVLPAAAAAPTDPGQPPAPGGKPGAKPATPPQPAPNRKPADPAALAGQVPPAPQPDAIDQLVNDALSEWQATLSPMVAPLLAEIDKAVAAGESLESFRERLPTLAKTMDNGPLAERLARAQFFARLLGEADIDVTGQEGE